MATAPKASEYMTYRKTMLIQVMIALGCACIMVGVILAALWYVLAEPRSMPALQDDQGPIASPYEDALQQLDDGAWWSASPSDQDQQDQVTKALVLIREAVALENQGDLSGAVDLCRKALALYPDMVHVHERLGGLYLRLGRYQDAMESLKIAMEGAVDQRSLLNDLSVVYLHLGNPQSALETCRTLLRLDPTYALAAFNAGIAAARLGNRDEARAYYEQFIRLEPAHARASRELARIAVAEGQLDLALSHLIQAIQQEPDWHVPYLEAARLAALLGREPEALKYLSEAEPMVGPAAVYQLYQQPEFREIRRSEAGKKFEGLIATEARRALSEREEEPPAYRVEELVPREQP
ncbi:MAG: tetratricopeptide repeat protein [Kiritimatiellae bacterium]|nr:tetratricopeptide repeat protein [Kiritimatiellia bacterium]